jgi:hypothetical protein
MTLTGNILYEDPVTNIGFICLPVTADVYHSEG